MRNWFFQNAIVAKFKDYYKNSLSNFLGQTVGIDRSLVYISRAGIRMNNDLIWVGRAPNIAAKLSGVRNGYSTLITETVYNTMLDGAKFGGSQNQNMWYSLSWDDGGNYGVETIYGSTWWWKP